MAGWQNNLNEYLTFGISIFTLLGIGWKGHDELGRIRKELKTNTDATVETKNSAVDISEQLKAKMDRQFVKLQTFNSTRYREVNIAINENYQKLIQLEQKVKTLEDKINAITPDNKSKESGD